MSNDGYTREIAKIERTFLGFEDRRILTGYLHVSYGTAGQGVGGYGIETLAGPYLAATLKACGVDSWEQLKGRTVYVLSDPTTRRLVGIEPLPTEPGERFLFADVFGEPAVSS